MQGQFIPNICVVRIISTYAVMYVEFLKKQVHYCLQPSSEKLHQLCHIPILKFMTISLHAIFIHEQNYIAKNKANLQNNVMCVCKNSYGGKNFSIEGNFFQLKGQKIFIIQWNFSRGIASPNSVSMTMHQRSRKLVLKYHPKRILVCM